MIATNLTGWRRPALSDGPSAGEFSDTAWARCQLGEPYPVGGWFVPVEERDLAWRTVRVEVSPSVVREEDGTLILLTWDGSASDPRIVGIDLSDGSELTEKYRIGPAPIVSIAVTSQTGVWG